jgi:hypothetical protein
MNSEELETDARIDPLQLDMECLDMSETFCKWAQKSADARAEVDKLKIELERVESLLSLDIRANPQEYHLEKITEASVVATVKTAKSYLDVNEKLVEARRESALTSTAVTAMEMKKRMLEVLVTLHGQQYFAGPNIPRDLADLWIQRQKEAESKLNKRIVKRKRKKT